MNLNPISDIFIHPVHFEEITELKKARLIVKSSLLTSLFSTTYLLLSIVIDFQAGINFMIFNVIGFVLLPLLVKTTAPLHFVGNLYILCGAIAVTSLSYFSRGLSSPILWWLISVPILALLIVNRNSALIWGTLMIAVIALFGTMQINGYAFPEAYNTEWRNLFFIIVACGLLMIMLVIALVFEFNNTEALEALAERNAEIASLNNEKDYIIQIMAHDLRNPLQGIKNGLHLLSRDIEDDKPHQMIEIMEESVDKSAELITKVTTMGAIEQHRLSMTLTSVELKKVLEGVIKTYAPLAFSKKIKLHKALPDDEVEANLDETFLIQIMDNLVSNAIKFSPMESSVWVRLKQLPGAIRIHVEDEGPGFSPEDQEKLFGKFTRLSAQPTGGESSTGLGLFLVKKYVELMEGSITCESEAGRGARFIIEFPN